MSEPTADSIGSVIVMSGEKLEELLEKINWAIRYLETAQESLMLGVCTICPNEYFAAMSSLESVKQELERLIEESAPEDGLVFAT